MRRLEWLGDSPNFQLNEIIIVSLVGSIPLFGIKISRQADHEVMITASKTFSSRVLGVIVNGATSISTVWFPDSWILGLREIAPCTGYWCRAYTGHHNLTELTHNFIIPVSNRLYPKSLSQLLNYTVVVWKQSLMACKQMTVAIFQ